MHSMYTFYENKGKLRLKMCKYKDGEKRCQALR